MSSKQIRVSGSTQLRQRIGEFINKQISLVLKNNTVFTGELLQVNPEQVVVQNMRLKKMSLPLSDILEFYADTTA